MAKPIAKEFIHSDYTRFKDRPGDVVVVKVHTHYDDNTVKPELMYVESPKRSFYVTKPGQRTHQFKREWEDLANVDSYTCYNHELESEVFRVLNGFRARRPPRLRELCASPYLYGADIDIQTLIKKKLQDLFEQSGLKPTSFTTGFLDTEANMLVGSNNETILITVTHENKVYTAILDRFFWQVDRVTGNRTKGNLDEFKLFSKKILDETIADLCKNDKTRKAVADRQFEYEYYIGEETIDLIKWIFARIHENRTDFVGVWNLDYDVPKIIGEIGDADVPLEDVFCPPEIPKHFRHVRYSPDRRENVDHITKRWHWLHSTAYTQFVDSMCLYSILRTVKGKEVSYSLDAILESNDLGGKLKFTDDSGEAGDLAGADWHRYMQTYEAYRYIVYNQFDAISLQIMEWKNRDIATMYVLTGCSHLSKYPRQTKKIADSMYFYCLEKGRVIATTGPNMTIELDQYITKVGGAVLPAERTYNIGLRILQEYPYLETMLHAFVSDVDFSSMYPTVGDGMNLSKETKVSTAVKIILDGKELDVQTYFSLMVAIPENAVKIGAVYYGLPNYTDADKILGDLLLPKAS